MSTPTPPGWQPPPQDQPAGAGQQPTQWTGYDPNRYQQQDETRAFDPNGPGGFSGPPGYQRPPQKNRAGLFIALLVVLLIAVLGVGGVVVSNLVSDDSSDTSQPGGLAPSDIPTEIPSDFPSYFPSDDPSQDPSQEPSQEPTMTLPTAGSGDLAKAKDLAQRFVTQLNANKLDAAAALGCAEAKQLLPLLFEAMIKAPTKLTVVGEPLGQSAIIVRLDGTTKGHHVTGIVLVQKADNIPLCIRALQVAPN